MMNITTGNIEWEKHLQRVSRLDAERRSILSLSAEKARRAILDHAKPSALVHSFAEEDFFFLIHDIGAFDALELLAMASDRQWEYILDVEIWQRDRINLKSVTHWLNLLLRAAPLRFMNWALNKKPDLIEYYLAHTIDVCIRAHDQDPSELDGDFFTFDDIFYVRLKERPGQREADPDTLEQQQAFLAEMLERLAMGDHVRYQETLLRAINVLPAESEEEAYRFRNVRLAEKGFLPFDEAVGVYQPIPARIIKAREKKISSRRTPELFYPIPFNHMAHLEDNNRFTRALNLIRIEEVLQQIQGEFAGLCNQIAAADQKPIHSREALRDVVKKACGYLEIGFERLAGKGVKLTDGQTASYIKTYPLIDIFRFGFGCVVSLQQRARRWTEEGWFAGNRLALNFWDEYFVGVIGGLLLKRPRHFDNYETAGLYRDFASLRDVKRAHTALKQAMAFDDLFSCLDLDIRNLPSGYFITYKNLLLTLWARHALSMQVRPHPVSADAFKPFYESIWQADARPGRIRESVKTEFLAWLSDASGFTMEEISGTLGRALEALFAEIEEEYGQVAAEELDHRFVTHFLLKP
jgi:hypothetical protein